MKRFIVMLFFGICSNVFGYVKSSTCVTIANTMDISMGLVRDFVPNGQLTFEQGVSVVVSTLNKKKITKKIFKECRIEYFSGKNSEPPNSSAILVLNAVENSRQWHR